MGKNILKVLALLLALSCLFGCTPAETPETQPPTEATTPPTVLDYDYPDLGLSFTFPEQWAGGITMEQNENSVTVILGGVPTFSFVSLKNEPGAKEEDLRLRENGYRYQLENGTHFFYYKCLSDLPEDFCIYQRGDLPAICDTEDALREIWQIDLDTEVCTVTRDPDYEHSCYLKMKTPHYINYRLGFMFTLPDFMFSSSPVYVKPFSSGIVDVMLWGEGNGVKTEYYCMATFYADPIKDQEMVSYYRRHYPELVILNGVVYGGANEWMSCWERGFESYHEWGTFPQAIRDYFTYEQVQELVDSYQVMLTAEELHADLDSYLPEQ